MGADASHVVHLEDGAQGSVTLDKRNRVVTKRYFEEADFERELKIMRLLTDELATLHGEEGEGGIVRLLGVDVPKRSIRMTDGGQALVDLIVAKPLHDWHHLHVQIEAAVALLHARDIVHGDLKPDNILVDDERRVRLCDFGHSRRLEAHERHRESLVMPRGTRPYACPEVLQGRKYDGMAADVWSLGVVLCAMILQRCPFEEATSACPCYERYRDGVLLHGLSPAKALLRVCHKGRESDVVSCIPFADRLKTMLHPMPKMRVRLLAA